MTRFCCYDLPNYAHGMPILESFVRNRLALTGGGVAQSQPRTICQIGQLTLFSTGSRKVSSSNPKGVYSQSSRPTVLLLLVNLSYKFHFEHLTTHELIYELLLSFSLLQNLFNYVRLQNLTTWHLAFLFLTTWYKYILQKGNSVQILDRNEPHLFDSAKGKIFLTFRTKALVQRIQAIVIQNVCKSSTS